MEKGNCFVKEVYLKVLCYQVDILDPLKDIPGRQGLLCTMSLDGERDIPLAKSLDHFLPLKFTRHLLCGASVVLLGSIRGT